MSYTLDEVIPFIYSDIDSNPCLKDGIFTDPELREAFDADMEDLMGDAFGAITLTFEEFTATNDETGETRTFLAKTFNLEVTNSEKILDDSYEGKTWLHYDNYLTDVETGDKYILSPYYYWSNYDLIGIGIEKLKPKVKKAKKQKTVFVAVQRTPEDYTISGIFKTLEKAVEAQVSQSKSFDKHIEEVPMDCDLSLIKDGSTTAIIAGALNVFDLEGNVI